MIEIEPKTFSETYGKVFEPKICPPFLKRGKVGDCFDCVLINALMFEGFKYVEGVARSPTTGEWLHHAWLTDEKERFAYDVTWKAYNKFTHEEMPVPTKYVGIVLDKMLVAKLVKDTEYNSVFKSGWRSPEILKELLRPIYEK